MAWLRSLFSAGPRVAGRPPSPNGASSFHVRWSVDDRLDAVSATLEVVEAPAVERLYFFALQASFWSNRHEGGAHVGLQWNPRHPSNTAVNWGGYDAVGRVLDGSTSDRHSTPSDPNTRDYPWQPNTPYRLTIGPRAEDGWPAYIAGPGGGDELIRTLHCPGDHLRAAVVWMEVFADCDHPPVAIRWSDMTADMLEGERLAVTSGSITYQSHADGGCANTTVLAEPGAVVQRSASERTTPHNAALSWEA